MRINIALPEQNLRGPDGIKLELDATEIFPHDPGLGTPALVVLANGNTGSFACVCAEGETSDGDQLTPAQCAWLNSLEASVDRWLNHHTQDVRGEMLAAKRSGDRVDGYDRDDTGESPDY